MTSEEMPQEAPKTKQYLMMASDVTTMILSKICPSIQFLEVEGMSIKDDPNHMIMVTPVKSSQNGQETQLEPVQEV